MVWPKSTVFLLGLLTSAHAAASNLYCCQDPVSNRRVCADLVPDQCKGRGHKVIDRNGVVIREVGPPLSAEEKAEMAAEAKRKLARELEEREQRRLDAALLETYPSLEDIERLQARVEADIKQGMALAEERIDEAKKRRQKFENEAEFYKKKELPTDVRRGLKSADDEINAQQNLLVSKQQDLATTRAKYAEDKRRYRELTSQGTRALHPAAGPTRRQDAATGAK